MASEEYVEYDEDLSIVGAIEPIFVGTELRWLSTLPPKEPEVDWEAYEDLMSLY